MGLVARTNKSVELARIFTESAYADPNLDATEIESGRKTKRIEIEEEEVGQCRDDLFSRDGPNEQFPGGWRAVPASGFPPDRSVLTSRRSPSPTRPKGPWRATTAREALRWKRGGRASPQR